MWHVDIFEMFEMDLSPASVSKPAPQWEGTAVINGEFKELKLSDYRGKYIVFFFYPLDLWVTSGTHIALPSLHLSGRDFCASIINSLKLLLCLQHICLPHWDHCIQRSCAWVPCHQYRGGRLLCRLPVHPPGLVRLLSHYSHKMLSDVMKKEKKLIHIDWLKWKNELNTLEFD